VAEMINLWAKGGSVVEDPTNVKIDFRQVLEGCGEAFRRWPVVMRGSAIGAGVGALPGVGGTVAAFLAYTVAAQSDRNRENFGKGEIAGVIAPESANNAKEGGALIPTLAFGIPGSAEMAVFLGVLVLHGLAPGPTIMTMHMDVIWTLIIATVISGVIGAVITLVAASPIARLTLVDNRTLVPIVMSFALIGSYSLSNEILDVALTVAFGLIGYGFMRLGYPRLTFPIALVLGPIMEVSYYQSMRIGDGSHFIFIESLPAKILAALLVVAICYPTARFLTRRRRRAAPAE
jgi:putative tricarboxylic transport membrane protein